MMETHQQIESFIQMTCSYNFVSLRQIFDNYEKVKEELESKIHGVNSKDNKELVPEYFQDMLNFHRNLKHDFCLTKLDVDNIMRKINP